jgi:hypothetical protein
MARGDHIWVRRLGYTHHGVEVDDAMVVHFTGTPGNKRGALICKDPMELFARDATVHLRVYGSRFDADEVVKRAESYLGRSGYNLFSNNCEHFARWCLTDNHKSSQVDTVVATGGVGASAATAAGGLGVISAVGVTSGLSGPGIMSGLATAGSIVGTGAVGGLVVLGAAPGALSVAVMNVALRDDPALPDGERFARRTGRGASVLGAAGGGAAGVAAVSAAGSVAGLSAAGITSGLAAIGGVVGGGMAAGSVIVIAVPAVAAAGAGYGSYRAVKFLRERPPGDYERLVATTKRVRHSVTEADVPKVLRRSVGGLVSSTKRVGQSVTEADVTKLLRRNVDGLVSSTKRVGRTATEVDLAKRLTRNLAGSPLRREIRRSTIPEPVHRIDLAADQENG